jgi:hypothetical protein
MRFAGRLQERIDGLIVAAGAALLLFLTNFRGRTPIYLFYAGDAGLWIDEAKRVLAGDVLYRDFFEFIGPGVVYWNALLFRLFGLKPESLAIGVIVAGVVLASLFHRLARHGSTRAASIAAPFLFLSLVYINYSPGNHKWLALAMILGALVILTGQVQPAGAVLAAGALFGGAVLCTQDLAGGAAVGVFIALLAEVVRKERPARDLMLLVAGACLAAALLMSYFVATAGFGRVVQDVVIFPLTRYHRVNRFSLQPAFYEGLSRLPRTIGHALMLAGCILLAIQTVIRRWRDDSPGRRWATTIAAAGLGMALPALPYRGLEPPLFAVQTAVLIPLLAAWLHSSTRPRRLAAALILLACVTSAGAVLYKAQLSTSLTRTRYRAGTVMTTHRKRGVEWIEQNVPRGGVAFAFPIEGGSYFLSDTKNATSYGFIEEAGFSPPSQLEEVMAELRTSSPNAGVWNDYGVANREPLRSTLAPVYRDVLSRYDAKEKTPERLTLFLRKPAPPVTNRVAFSD